MTLPPVYRQCGLRLRSEVPLPLPLAAGGEWDVDIRWGQECPDSAAAPPGEVVASYEAGGISWYTATDTGHGFCLRFRNVGEVVLSADVSQVEVRRDPRGGHGDLLPILLAGTVTAFVLALRGHTVLHASAVAVGDVALAFVGQSGRGKSTIAGLMCVAGADLVTDDVLSVDPGPPATCIGGAAEVRLRPAAAGIAQALPDAATVTRMTADERVAFAPRGARPERLPLAGIVVPAPSRTATCVEVRRIPPSGALFVLLSFPRVHGWRRPDVLSREFSALTELVNRVPVHEVIVPWGPPFSPDVAPALRALATPEPTPVAGDRQ